MTVIYVPRLIESAEQAEALPLGTVVLEVLTEPGEEERVIGADFIDDGFDEDLTPGGNWHHVALVPIEAEEEWGGSRPNGGAWECQNRSHAEDDAAGWNRSAGPDGFHSTPVRRLVTPWGEA